MQPQLSAAARVNQARISLCENGVIRLSDAERGRIERVLDVLVDWEGDRQDFTMTRTK